MIRWSPIRKLLRRVWRYSLASAAVSSAPLLAKKAWLWVPRDLEEFSHLLKEVAAHLFLRGHFVLLLVAGLGAHGVAFAEGGYNGIIYSPHHLFVGFGLDAQGRTSATGSPWGGLWGVAGSYDYVRSFDWYVGGRLSWVNGNMHNGTKHNIKDLDVEGRWGYTWFFCCGPCLFYATPFVGIGWRELTDRFIGAASTTFTYKKWYLPVGIRGAWLALPWLEMGVDLEFTFDVDPVVRTGSASVTSELQNLWGVRLELPITYHHAQWVCCGWEARLVPFGRWERFGKPKYGPTTARFGEWDGGFLFQIGYRL